MMIEVHDLRKTYTSGDTEVRALRGVSLKIQRGEFVSPAGPSGSGKTTMLNIIGCIDAPDSGDVLINERSVTNLKRDRQAAFAWGPQHILAALRQKPGQPEHPGKPWPDHSPNGLNITLGARYSY